jgi:hypothetical protein
VELRSRDTLPLKIAWFFTVVLLLSFLTIPMAESQNEDNTVLEIINLYLPKNETHDRPVTLVSYAPHELDYQVSPVNVTVSEALARIRLDSDEGSITLIVYHNTLHHNTSFTPRTSNFNLNIENEGYVDISINFTITQIGDPITAFYSKEDVTSKVLIPSIIIIIIPLIIPLVGIAIYRRLKLNDIVAGKLNINPNIIALVMTGSALLSPRSFHIDSDVWDPLEFEVSSVFWRFHSNVNPPFRFYFPRTDYYGLTTTFLSLMFCFVIYRCYQARNTRKHAIIVGLLSLILPLYFGILSIIHLLSSSSPFFSIYGPIPFLLLIGLILLFLFPPPKPPKAWDDGLEPTNEE